MSLSSQVSSLATRLGQEIKALWVAVNAKVTKVTATDNAIVRFNGTAGEVQNSLVQVDDNGKLVTVASTSDTAAFNVTTGTIPSSPVDGDVWATSSSLFTRINGVTVDLLQSGASYDESNTIIAQQVFS